MVMVLPLIMLLLILGMQLGRDLRIVARAPERTGPTPLHRAGLLFVALLLVPYGLVFHGPVGGNGLPVEIPAWWLSVIIAALISYTWYRYLTWLDRFERERIYWELAVFVIACGTTLLVFPLTPLVAQPLGLQLDGTAWNDWWYSVLAIGLVEETVKLLPLLALMHFTRQADEPFDLLLYGSIAALGFAFVENILYLDSSDLMAVGGRALYASVAHMFFSSIIAYALALARHRKRSLLLHGLLGLVLASLAHGFYDFWLLSPGRPGLITLLFFLASIHLWVVLKNNLINLSPHYLSTMRPATVMFRYRIINGMLFIFALTFVLRHWLFGQQAALDLVREQGLTMASTLLFLAISFSSYRFVPGYLAPLRLPSSIWRWVMPVVHWGEDLTGTRLQLSRPGGRSAAGPAGDLLQALPVEGTLVQRVVIDDDPDWYLFRTEQPLHPFGFLPGILVIRPHADHDAIPGDRHVLLSAMGVRDASDLSRGVLQRQHLQHLAPVLGRSLPAH